MNERSIYKDIALRTGGDIYIGVVGPVRSGKSTFIKKFMEELVLPNIAEGYSRERAIDELPQSAQGKTVMTTEPKFVPEDAVRILIDGNAEMNVRLVDCVGYLHPEALGATEDGKARMVKTPWSSDEMEFTAAAEFGTRKVIKEHSTIGMVVTTDGSIGEISRRSYEEAEKRIIAEMKSAGKPFAVILNSEKPESEEAERLAMSLEEEYGVPVALVNVLRLSAEDIKHILGLVLDRFPITEVKVKLPDWIMRLDGEHRIKKSIMDSVRSAASSANNMGDVFAAFSMLASKAEGTPSRRHANMPL
jgi:stage IV sporulation protein A